jgi:hypothetical protein
MKLNPTGYVSDNKWFGTCVMGIPGEPKISTKKNEPNGVRYVTVSDNKRVGWENPKSQKYRPMNSTHGVRERQQVAWDTWECPKNKKKLNYRESGSN